MSLDPKKLKREILKSGKSVGISIDRDSRADKVITRGTALVADVVNEGEKEGRKLAKDARTTIDRIRAKVHEATAPKKRRR